jgi:hypothetical protein
MCNERRFSGVKKERDDLNHYLLRNSSEYPNSTTYITGFTKDSSFNVMGCQLEEREDHSTVKLMRKMTTPTVVRMEFQE